MSDEKESERVREGGLQESKKCQELSQCKESPVSKNSEFRQLEQHKSLTDYERFETKTQRDCLLTCEEIKSFARCGTNVGTIVIISVNFCSGLSSYLILNHFPLFW